MSWTVRTLDLGAVELNRRRMIANASGNGLVRVPVQGWLLLRGNEAIVIDTGFRHPDILKRLGDSAAGVEAPDQRLVRQLALHGLEPGDVRYVLHTHLHIDHAGQGAQSFQRLIHIAHALVVTVINRLSHVHLPAEYVFRIETRRHADQHSETANHQSRSGKQYQTQRHFRHDQRIAPQPQSAAAGRAFRARFQHFVDVRSRRFQNRQQAEQQRQSEIKDALNSIVKTMGDHDIGLEELFDHLRASGFQPKTSRKSAGKPRGPNTANQFTTSYPGSHCEITGRLGNIGAGLRPPGKRSSSQTRAPTWRRICTTRCCRPLP